MTRITDKKLDGMIEVVNGAMPWNTTTRKLARGGAYGRTYIVLKDSVSGGESMVCRGTNRECYDCLQYLYRGVKAANTRSISWLVW